MRLRLTLSFILIVVVATASVALIARRQTVFAVNAFIFRGGLSGTEGLVRNLEAHYAANGTWDGVESLFNRQGRGLGQGQGPNSSPGWDQRLQLADVDGNILVDTQDESPNQKISRADRNRSISLNVDGQIVGYLLPETGSQISQLAADTLVSRINQAAIKAAIFASAVALGLALFLSYRLLRPVSELTQAVQKLADGDLVQRVPVRGSDELATLADTFNQMLASLQLAESRRQALTADIAHELRTPLAVQRAHLEALEDGIYDLNIESLKPIEEHNYLLTRLVEDLRTLALADSGQLELVKTPTDLSDLVKRVITRLEPQAADRQIKIRYSLSESPLYVNVDPQRIEQILNNLLDNAMRYTTQGGWVRIQTSIIDKICILTVQDNGPGISSEDIHRIFERFYRAEKSRSRAEGGTGLGLSIAKKIASAHGGSLKADNHPDGGAIFTLTLPIE
jgi:two-component system sensor histidine kinase BaeS